MTTVEFSNSTAVVRHSCLQRAARRQGITSRISHDYKDMQDMVENVKLDISGVFLARFL